MAAAAVGAVVAAVAAEAVGAVAPVVVAEEVVAVVPAAAEVCLELLLPLLRVLLSPAEPSFSRSSVP